MDTSGQKASARDQSAFDNQYVSTNIPTGAPKYSKELVDKLRRELLDIEGDESTAYSYGILTAMFIGAHRGDFVPGMFEDAIDAGLDEVATAEIFYMIRECVMAIWAFVGVPWCVPACLGCVAVLKRKGLLHIGAKTMRPQELLNIEKLLEKGKGVNAKTYGMVDNSEVRSMLADGFPEMRLSISALVWGYNIGGAWDSGIVTGPQTELMVAAAIVAGGASRQSRSHVKASIGMGNRVEVVRKVVGMITEFAAWNKTPLPHVIDVDGLAGEVIG